MSYFNSKEVIISSSIGYLQYRIEVIPVDIGEAVRARILDLCRERNLSINKLCLLSGVTQSTVNNIVSGRNHSATVTTIKKLCDGLGISIEEYILSKYKPRKGHPDLCGAFVRRIIRNFTKFPCIL